MAKKNKSKEARKPAQGGSGRTLWLVVALVGALVVAGWGYTEMTSGPVHGKSFQVKGGEHKPVLDPFNFPNRSQFMAYAAAQKYPQAMDQVYCYCNCDQPPFYHKSLLSCFTDYHGAG